ncbi:hypothetical protein SmJEL517_g04552 [Synchytrium microbalum]|uniref:C2HC/C3H-type domain-containing protein n=1 Tax=Synchytrium microbalum TaxID=1806994 RepID=A0A507C2R9_9FUNG|nr:uncharacterized protein SmJEL517_g04552 [Synchytrium microbalum]TPX32374.1 hypothetical protein SmJEL517_g04552 [Synchytrium microbalum]
MATVQRGPQSSQPHSLSKSSPRTTGLPSPSPMSPTKIPTRATSIHTPSVMDDLRGKYQSQLQNKLMEARKQGSLSREFDHSTMKPAAVTYSSRGQVSEYASGNDFTSMQQQMQQQPDYPENDLVTRRGTLRAFFAEVRQRLANGEEAPPMPSFSSKTTASSNQQQSTQPGKRDSYIGNDKPIREFSSNPTSRSVGVARPRVTSIWGGVESGSAIQQQHQQVIQSPSSQSHSPANRSIPDPYGPRGSMIPSPQTAPSRGAPWSPVTSAAPRDAFATRPARSAPLNNTSNNHTPPPVKWDANGHKLGPDGKPVRRTKSHVTPNSQRAPLVNESVSAIIPPATNFMEAAESHRPEKKSTATVKRHTSLHNNKAAEEVASYSGSMGLAVDTLRDDNVESSASTLAPSAMQKLARSKSSKSRPPRVEDSYDEPVVESPAPKSKSSRRPPQVKTDFDTSISAPTSPSTLDDNINDGRVPCHVCHRRFAGDRLQKHQVICEKSAAKKSGGGGADFDTYNNVEPKSPTRQQQGNSSNSNSPTRQEYEEPSTPTLVRKPAIRRQNKSPPAATQQQQKDAQDAIRHTEFRSSSPPIPTLQKKPAGAINSFDEYPIAPSNNPNPFGPEAVAPARNLHFEECRACGRSFAPDRIEKHESICGKPATNKKRKVFDPRAMRAKGTELEEYAGSSGNSGLKKKNSMGAKKSAAAERPIEAKGGESSWRDKHDELIKALRAAKGLQNHLAAGGKASDLPPPEPAKNNGVECPHCSRKFAVASLERHEPICAKTVHKPNGPPGKRGGASKASTKPNPNAPMRR